MAAKSDLPFMRLAVELAGQCQSEDGRPHPKVAAVLVKNGEILGTAFRGEEDPGAHAEYILLDKKLRETAASGATLYTTLEPCTRRSPSKVACAKRVVDRKLARVVIGQVDPDPRISGDGQRAIREANIHLDLFTPDLMSELEDLNREWLRTFPSPMSTSQAVQIAPVTAAPAIRRLDEWYQVINAIYYEKNYARDPEAVFAHLVEVIGGLSQLVTKKQKLGIKPITFFPKAFAWWMALCGRLGIRSIERLIWTKFPYVCSYCRHEVHNDPECKLIKKRPNQPEWAELRIVALANTSKMPTSLAGWQRMFGITYPPSSTEEYAKTFGRLTEELGELAESVRVFRNAPTYFLSEAADVFGWLMHLQNLYEELEELPGDQRLLLESEFAKSYPGHCIACGRRVCSCKPILEIRWVASLMRWTSLPRNRRTL